MIAALLLIAWGDWALAHVAAPGWLTPITGSGFLPPGLLLGPLSAAVTAAICVEAARLLRAGGSTTVESVTTALSGIVGFTLVASGAGGAWVVAGCAASAVGATVWRMRNSVVEGAAAAATASLLASVFLGGLLGLWMKVRVEDALVTMVAGVLVVKSSDIGAYFVGAVVGRRKLIVWLSPGKTWEGLLGGVVVAASVSVLIGAVARSAGWQGAFAHIPLWALGIVGVILALLGQVSDLFASALKRNAGAKDSSSVIPGFGGLLDVVDSLLLTAPVLVALTQFVFPEAKT